jgi:hypothetical protein
LPLTDTFSIIARPDMHKTAGFVLTAMLLLLPGCDRLADMLEMPDPARDTADAQAIGSACRQAGRSIEDCYTLNPDARKSSVFEGWKSMSEYMKEHALKEVPSVIPPGEIPAHSPGKPAQPAVAKNDGIADAQQQQAVAQQQQGPAPQQQAAAPQQQAAAR